MSGMHLSKEFFELLKAIGESKSKQEEDRIILKEVQTLKHKLETPSSRKGAKLPGASGQNVLATNKKKAKEFLVRMLYVEMLGHDASFGYIKAVELAASSSIMHKRTGYLVCASVLSPEHEFRFMLVNQMQRDLVSQNVLVTVAALIAVTNIITSDMVPAISTEVTKLLGHASDQVRKKSMIALHRLHQIAPEVVTHEELCEKLRRHLCDRDPSVMGASLNVIEALAMKDAKPFKDLVPSLISILKQIIEHRLPSDFDYHRVPAPWLQLKIVRILAILGKNDANASNGMYEMLSECLKRADIGINAGYAIVYECVRTITAIYPNPTLLDSAAEAISRFISSRSHNLKYMGITGLAGIVESHPQYAAAHQVVVIECLEDSDESLQRRTLDLLYKMTNPVNVEFITEKMLDFLRGTTDLFLRKDLTLKVCRLAERYAPNNIWYVQTITDLFEISGDLIKPDVAQNLMTLIAEGAGDGEEDDEEADMLLRQHAVEMYAILLDRPNAKLPQLLIETMAWVLGEYAYLSAEYTLEEILERLCTLVRKGKQILPSTRKILISSIMKLVAQAGTCPPQAAKVIDDFTKSKDVDLQQRCLEFQNMLTSAANILPEVLPVDASCEDVDVDVNLMFLDRFVGNAIANGAQEYKKPDDDDDDDEYYGGASKSGASAFKMTPYEKPTQPGASFGKNMSGVGSNISSVPGVSLPPGASYNSGAPSQTNHNANPPSNEPQLNLRNVANVWGKGGISQSQPYPTVAAPTPAVTTPSSTAASSTINTANSWSNSYTSQTQQPQEPVKTEEQLRKEKMAAALFGGTASGSKESFRPSLPKRKTKPAVFEAAPPAPAVPAPPQPPAPAPAPEPIIDLLDFGSDPIPAAAPTTTNFDVDILSPSPVSAPEPSIVEVEAEPTPAPAPTVPDDPFANAGLLDNLGDSTLDGLMTDTRFEFSGKKLTPLNINTAQFGQKWGSCAATSSVSETTAKVETLEKVMNMLESSGLYKVETIAATNEGICAGMVGGTNLSLVHAKVSPLGAGSSKLDLTVKSTDQSLAGCLAMFLQNMLR